MGSYTTLKCDIRLKSDVPANVIEILKFMMGETDVESTTTGSLWYDEHQLGDHPLFKTTRWDVMLVMESSRSMRSLNVGSDGTWRLKSVSSFKNYDDEIHLFFDWILPYVLPTSDPIGIWYMLDFCDDDDQIITTASVVDGKVEIHPFRKNDRVINLPKEMMGFLPKPKSEDPEVGAVYRHFKNRKLFEVVAVGKMEDSHETMVAYKAVDGGQVLTRTLSSWKEPAYNMPHLRYEKVPKP